MFDGQPHNRKHRIFFWLLGVILTTIVTGGVGGSIGMQSWKNLIDQESAIGQARRYDALRQDFRGFNDELRGYRENQIDPMLRGLNDRITKGPLERWRDKRQQRIQELRNNWRIP